MCKCSNIILIIRGKRGRERKRERGGGQKGLFDQICIGKPNKHFRCVVRWKLLVTFIEQQRMCLCTLQVTCIRQFVCRFIGRWLKIDVLTFIVIVTQSNICSYVNELYAILPAASGPLVNAIFTPLRMQ